MAASKKLSLIGDDELLNDLMSTSIDNSSDEEKIETKKIKPVKTAITFRLNEDIKTQIEKYCAKYDMTITAAIKKAMREMLQREGE